MIRRINFFAGPGAGKSTCAAKIFSELKITKNVELINEYVKAWAYENRTINKFDQVYIFSKQLRKEYIALMSGVDTIITDAPIVLALCYAKRNGLKEWLSLYNIASAFEEDFPSINIFLDRDNCNYQDCGRYESFEEAIEMDNLIKDTLDSILDIEYITVKFDDYNSIIRLINDANI